MQSDMELIAHQEHTIEDINNYYMNSIYIHSYQKY